MNQRSLKALEFPKILEHLAAFCLSEAGQEACLSLRPAQDLALVHYEQELYNEYGLFSAATSYKHSSFTNLNNLFGLMHTSSQTIELDALFALKETLNQAKLAASSLSEEVKNCPRLEALCDSGLPEQSLSVLNRCISSDGRLKDESSPGLMLIRSEIRSIHQGCLRQVKDFAARYNIGHFLQDEYMSLSSDRYVLPLKSSFKGRLQGIIHDYSQTGETCYFEPMFLVEQNNRLQELKREEREEEHKVVLYINQIIRSELPLLKTAFELLVKLDVLFAKHNLGQSYHGRCAIVDDQTRLNLENAYHPLLALDRKIKAQPLDLILREDDQVLVISGGNAGGKTVCLKTLGLISLMTLAALPVPVKAGSTLAFWPKLYAFIGDEQSLDDHVSTFTAQIQNLKPVWAEADNKCLILLDEFGAGTDPAQGAALAQAVLDELIAQKANVIAATHFPSLKTYALTHEKVRAASVLFNPATRQPLFRLAYDQVGASQALEVAKEHGLPEAVIKRASQYLLQDGQDTNTIIDRLNTLGAQREKELDSLRQEQAKTKEKRSRLEERFALERNKLEQEIRQLSKNIMLNWQENRISHRQAMKELAKARAEIAINIQEEQADKPVLPLDTLKTGQQVLYIPWNKSGQISEIDSRQNRLKLDINGVSLWVNLDQVKDSNQKPKAVSTSVRTSTSSLPRSLILDLRGKRADVAEAELGKFLDSAILNSYDEVEIIHGRGTGALRKQVHNILKSFPNISSYVLAPEDRGGDGMTIASFR